MISSDADESRAKPRSENPAPLISVIVAVYNAEATLQQCIDSVVQQTYPYKELIIIDGNSSDGTAAILEKNREKIRYCLSEPDHGIYNAWNKALPHAGGDWICFLGADDFFWNAGVLEKMSEHLQTLPPGIRVAYGRIRVLDSGGDGLYSAGQPWSRIKNRFKNAMCIPHPGVMHRRSLFEQHGTFDESFRIAADYEFLMRELTQADAYFVPDLIVVGMRQGGISSTPANLWLALGEIRRAQRMHGCTPPGHLRFLAVLSVLFRLFLIRVFGETRIRTLINWTKRVKER
ncbi:MAG: glycosyltransferase family 2 protein [Gammaproteobacteria bacterium]